MMNVAFDKEPSGIIKVVETQACFSLDAVNEFHGACISVGYEGSIIRTEDVYQPGKRSKFLLKRKDFHDAEFEIVRVEEGVGNKAGMAGSIIFRSENGNKFGAGIEGGLSMNRLYWAKRNELPGKTATVCYFKLTDKSHVPRFAKVKDVHYEGCRRD